MLTLEQTQYAMMDALDLGPDYLPQGLFAGPAARIITGMKVHANTISHARLVALEETFPRVLGLLGHAVFNHHSRNYLSRPEAGITALAHIGWAFPEYIADIEEVAFAASLARFDWQWLEVFRAPDAAALLLADLAGIIPEELPQIVLQAHPAAYMMTVDQHVRKAIGAEMPDVDEAGWMLLVRPADQVRILPVTDAMRSIFDGAILPASICNLLAGCDEQQNSQDYSPDAAMQALIALIEAGALCKVR